MSPHPIPSLSGFNPIMSRRVLFGGATAVAAAGVLSACGSSSSKTEHKASAKPHSTKSTSRTPRSSSRAVP